MGKRIALDNHNIPKKRKKTDYHSGYKNASQTSYTEDETNKVPSVENLNFKDSPQLEFELSEELVYNTIVTDINKKQWRIGIPIGKGSFGEIFLATDNVSSAITNENAKYVVKIEPHSNGPLFVEIHCLLNTAKPTEEEPLPPGMPEYIASGSHYFGNVRYRFLVLPRFTRDLHSIIKNRRVDKKSVLILGVQILEILQHIHNKGYCHSDIKAENLMVGKCRKPYVQRNSHNSSSHSDDDGDNENDDKEDCMSEMYQSNESEANSSGSEDSDANYRTPIRNRKKIRPIQYSGSNPVRTCRTNKQSNAIYQEMINSHYLRPAKKINYTSFFDDENSNSSGEKSVSIDQYISNHRLSKSSAKSRKSSNSQIIIEENRIFLIDFGLASKFVDSFGVHRPFCMDQRRAHDGTLEFTSRDAHMGAHSRRSDLECLGYNLIFWSQGYLPWKENAAQLQHEKVHWMKEYFMTDVKEMLKHIYGKQVPKYLGEFMCYVGKLAYDERPDYIKCKKIFQREYQKLNCDPAVMQLNVDELIQNSVHINDEIENNNFCEMKNIKSIMKNLGVLMPFRESNSNRVSPKNLRSKSDKSTTKKKKKFSWAEILSQDPDQIARERAEKEFEREEAVETPIIRFTGKPTYAILEIQNKLKFKDRLDAVAAEEDDNDFYDLNTKGYTKPMIDLLKKRQVAEYAQLEAKKKLSLAVSASSPATDFDSGNHNSSQKLSYPETVKRTRTKEGLRTTITQTKRAVDYNLYLVTQKSRRIQNRFTDKITPATNTSSCVGQNIFETDDNSCSSLMSIASSNNNSRSSIGTSSKKSSTTVSSTKQMHGYREPDNGNSNSSSITTTSAGGATSSSFPASLSDEDTRDVMVAFNPKRTRQTVKKLKIKISGPTPAIVKEHSISPPQGSRRRKKSVPKKRNQKGKNMRCV